MFLDGRMLIAEERKAEKQNKKIFNLDKKKEKEKKTYS